MTNVSSNQHVNLENLKMDSNFAMLLCSLVFAVSWVIYITFYNSRVVGYIITKIANKFFISEGFFKIGILHQSIYMYLFTYFTPVGSLTMNALSGKIMFRDVIYITHDYTIRVQDGYLIFRWWRSYVPKDVSEGKVSHICFRIWYYFITVSDLSHSDTRLSVMLNGFELHVYNRSEMYAKLEKVFGLGSNIFPNNNDNKVAEDIERLVISYKIVSIYDNFFRAENESQAVQKKSGKKQKPEAAMAKTWRDLIPVIKCDISSVSYIHMKLFLSYFELLLESSSLWQPTCANNFEHYFRRVTLCLLY